MRNGALSTFAEPRWARWLASGFGSGFLPRFPGTWGSVAAGLLACPWFLDHQVVVLLLGALAWSMLGLATLARLEAARTDAGWIVVDEFAGTWLALAVAALAGAHAWTEWVFVIVLFRAFDIAKPWPIGRMEQVGPPHWRVMGDDLAAGLLGGATAALALRLLA